MPTDPPSAETGRKGLRFIADAVEEMHFIYREMPQPDLGLDCQIELKEGKFPTGQFILVQSKAGRSHMENLKPHAFDFYSDPNHLVYWKECENAVILVVYDPEEKVGYWKDVQAYLRQHPEIIEKRPHKIIFDRQKDRFTPDCADALRGLFGPSHANEEKVFCAHIITKHSKLTLYSVTSDRPLSVELEKVFVTLTATKKDTQPVIRGDLVREGKFTAQGRLFQFTGEVRQKNQPPEQKTPSSELPDVPVEFRETEITLSLNTVLRNHPCLVITGEPGAGKTTLLKYLALAFARGIAEDKLELDEQRVPILIALRDLNVFVNNSIDRGEIDAFGPNVFPAFLHEYFNTTAPHLRLSKDFFPSLLDSARCALLFDGLDEVADVGQRARMSQLVAEIIAAPSWKLNRFVVTSRPRGYSGEPKARLSSRCADCSIRPFDDKDIEAFTRAWYDAVTVVDKGDSPEAHKEAADNACKLVRAIQADPCVRGLGRNPLLLSVLAMVHQRNVELPRRRARLYWECTEFLLGYWDELRTRDSVVPLKLGEELDPGVRRAVLEPVALWLHQRGAPGTEVERGDLEEQLAVQFGELGHKPPEAKRRAAGFLRLIADRSGLLLERSPGVFAFTHLTFQEFLVARALTDREDGLATVLAHLHDPWWREVTLLYGSLLSEVDRGPRRARKGTSEFLRAIRHAGSWLEDVIKRDLLFSVRCLGDMEEAGVDPAVRNELAGEAAALWLETRWDRQRNDIVSAFRHSCATPQGRQFITALQRELSAPETPLGKAAADALGALGSAADVLPVLTRLLERSHDCNIGTRKAAVDALGRLGRAAFTPEVMARLLGTIRDADYSVGSTFAQALAKCGSAVFDAEQLACLLELSQDPDARTRESVVDCLWKLGRRARRIATPEVLARLFELSRDSSGHVQFVVVGALGDLCHGEATQRAITWLLGLIGHPSDDMRLVAGYALAKLVDDASAAAIVCHLLELTRSPSLGARDAAVQALGFLGRRAASPSVLHRLLEFVSDPDDVLRGEALRSVESIFVDPYTKAFLDCLLNLFHDRDVRVRHLVPRLLCRMAKGANRPVIVARFLELTKDPIPGIRVAVAGGLATIYRSGGVPELLPRLLELSQDSSAQVRSGMARLLGEIGHDIYSESVVDRLLELSRDDESKVRAGAVWALPYLIGSVRGAEVIGRLLELAKADTDDVCQAVVKALANIVELPDENITARLVLFWRGQLSETSIIWDTTGERPGTQFEKLGNFAYGQLQQLAAQRARPH